MLFSFTFTEEAKALYDSEALANFYPERATPFAAAFDLRALKKEYIYSGDISMISTGIMAAIPEGYFGMIVPRSGQVFKKGLTVANSPGIVDADYRGEIKVLLHKFALEGEQGEIHWIAAGERIAQMLIMKHESTNAMLVSAHSFAELQTLRGSGGFGSTGS